jgi:hypothetical protein
MSGVKYRDGNAYVANLGGRVSWLVTGPFRISAGTECICYNVGLKNDGIESPLCRIAVGILFEEDGK